MDSLLAAAFVVGLAGGVHCVGMCGGIVAAVTLRAGAVHGVSPGNGATVAAGRASASQLSFQLAFNLGRISSYVVAGAVVGAIGSLGVLLDALFPVQLALRVVASTFVVLVGLYIAGYGSSVVRGLERAGAGAWRVAQRIGGNFFPPDTPGRAVVAGTVWGWLPCGLVYSVLATALVSGNAARGAAVMLAFGLGTLPTLVGAGLAAERLRRALQRPRVRLAAGMLVALLGLSALLSIPGLGERIRAGLLCLT
jgi:uncharacterized protein